MGDRQQARRWRQERRLREQEIVRAQIWCEEPAWLVTFWRDPQGGVGGQTQQLELEELTAVGTSRQELVQHEQQALEWKEIELRAQEHEFAEFRVPFVRVRPEILQHGEAFERGPQERRDKIALRCEEGLDLFAQERVRLVTAERRGSFASNSEAPDLVEQDSVEVTVDREAFLDLVTQE